MVDIAGGPKGNELNEQIMAGKYPGIVKTKLDGVDQTDYLTGKSDKSARDVFFYYTGSQPVGGALQELEDVLHDGAGYRDGLLAGAQTLSLDPASQPQARSVRAVGRRRRKVPAGLRRCARRAGNAYIYNWNMLPIGQLLWEKELLSYKEFPPMQAPETYNLDQVMEQIKKGTGHPSE